MAEILVGAFAFMGAAIIAAGAYGMAIGRVDSSGLKRYGHAAMAFIERTHVSVAGATAQASATEVPVATETTPATPTTPPSLVATPPAAPVFDRESVLSDAQNRVSPEFKISEGLRTRVGFWFDVYTKWGSNKRIIHDSRRPWVVYKVVDVGPILTAEVPRHKFLRVLKAEALVKSELAAARKAVAKASRAKKFEDLSPSDIAALGEVGTLPSTEVLATAKRSVGELRVQTGQRDFFMSGLVASPRYLTTMEKIFQAHGMPVELTRLPFVESSFNKAATSKVGASGIWQFMGGTGSKFLIVGDNIDERRSPYKATDAAARLLKENHLILGKSWPLAVTAWNHGPGGIRKASIAAGSRDLAVILDKYRTRRFDFASSNFYSEFLAALHAEKYKDSAFGPIATDTALDSFFIALPKSYRALDVMRLTSLSREEFTRLNPDLTGAVARNASLPRGFRLHIPSEARESIEAALRGGATAASEPTSKTRPGKT